MSVSTDENRVGIQIRWDTSQGIPDNFVAIGSEALAKSLFRAEVKHDRIGAEWQYEWDGDVLTISTDMGAAVPDEEAESKRYFGGNYADWTAYLKALPVDEDREPVVHPVIHQALMAGFDALYAEQAANLPRLQSVTRAALEAWQARQ